MRKRKSSSWCCTKCIVNNAITGVRCVKAVSHFPQIDTRYIIEQNTYNSHHINTIFFHCYKTGNILVHRKRLCMLHAFICGFIWVQQCIITQTMLIIFTFLKTNDSNEVFIHISYLDSGSTQNSMIQIIEYLNDFNDEWLSTCMPPGPWSSLDRPGVVKICH